MTEQWYYSLDGRQLGPVSFVILQQFAAQKQLLPDHLVWATGMSQWVPARTIDNLIPSVSDQPPLLPADRAAAVLTPRPAGFGSGFTLDEPAWMHEPMSRPRTPHRSSTSAITWVVVGSIAIVVVVIVAFIGLASLGWSSSPANPTTFSLRKGEMRVFHITFEGGKRAQIWVTSERPTDVDLFVCAQGVTACEAEDDFFVKDDRMAKDCYVEFTPQTTQTFQVIVWNRIHLPPDPTNEGHNTVTLKWSPDPSKK